MEILIFSETGDFNEVENLLKKGWNPNFQNNEGDTPLQVAAANGYTELVSLLLNYGAFIDLANVYGWTPLMHAAKYGHSATLTHLLKMKAKVNITNKLGISAIIAAICCGNLESVKLLIEAGAMVDHMSTGSETSECDLSAVMAASLYGHDSVLQYLIKVGAKIHHSSSITGLTPLMLAACCGHKQIITKLIENGVDFNQKDVCGRTALNYSIMFNQLDAKLCLENLTVSKYQGSFSGYHVFEKIKAGDISEVKSILENDSDFVKYSEPHNGITPLMMASISGQCNIANLLISFGAPLNSQDTQNRWTALMHAVYRKHGDIVRLLLENNVDVDVCASNGYTALDLATHNDDFEPTIIEMLVSKSTSQDPRNTMLKSDLRNRGRLYTDERLPSRRSLSQTKVKEWIGGVAQHLQNKMLTLRSPKCSENVPSIEITPADESSNEVFLEQTLLPKEFDKESQNDPNMLPPNLYLANALKEHKVEAIIPPFPPISMGVISYTKEMPKKSSDINSKRRINGLRLTHLLKKHRIKFSEISNKEEIEKSPLLSKSSSQLSKQSENEDISFEDYERVNSTSKMHNELTTVETACCKPSQGDLTMLLNKESMQKYVETFRNQEVDVETFLHLTEVDLSEIGIENTESQKKLMKLIKKFKETK